MALMFVASNVLASVEPIYRFWSSKNKSHFYTMSEAEKEYVINNYDDYVWKYEGISNYALNSNSISNNDISSDAAIDYSKLNLISSIQASDLASNGCSAGQILKYSGFAWTCEDDENTGSIIGNTVESSEITDGTIINVDISPSAAIEYSKLDLGTNISSNNITDDTIMNVDISPSAAIDSDKINFLHNNVDFGTGNINLSEVSGNDGSIRFNDNATSDFSYIKRTTNDFLEIGSTNDDPISLTETVYVSSGKNVHLGGDLNFSNDQSSITFASGVNGKISGDELPNSNSGVVMIDDILKLNPINDVSDTCDSTTEGMIYYSSTAHALKLCNGTSWVTVSAS